MAISLPLHHTQVWKGLIFPSNMFFLWNPTFWPTGVFFSMNVEKFVRQFFKDWGLIFYKEKIQFRKPSQENDWQEGNCPGA